jgi:hypothetical protein
MRSGSSLALRSDVRIETIQICDQLLLFPQPERGPVEVLEFAPRISQITLNPHGAEEDPTNQDLWGIRDELVLDRPAITGLRNDRVRRSPLEANRLAGPIPNGEPNALIHRVRQQIHDPAPSRVEVYLHDVSFRVAEEACLVTLIRGGVVETLLREGEHWLYGPSLRRYRARVDRQ